MLCGYWMSFNRGGNFRPSWLLAERCDRPRRSRVQPMRKQTTWSATNYYFWAAVTIQTRPQQPYVHIQASLFQSYDVPITVPNTNFFLMHIKRRRWKKKKEKKCAAWTDAADAFQSDACDTAAVLLRVYVIISWFHTWWHWEFWSSPCMLLPWWAIGKQSQLLLYNSTFHFAAGVLQDLSLNVSCHSRLPCPSAHLCFYSFHFSDSLCGSCVVFFGVFFIFFPALIEPNPFLNKLLRRSPSEPNLSLCFPPSSIVVLDIFFFW